MDMPNDFLKYFGLPKEFPEIPEEARKMCAEKPKIYAFFEEFIEEKITI